MQNQSHLSEMFNLSAWFRAYSEERHSDPYPFYAYLLKQEPAKFFGG
ncbi:hypothetical protein [Paenibacillus montanisoli]|nr:hypothetical protein [Paenibacillus montanisoli]